MRKPLGCSMRGKASGCLICGGYHPSSYDQMLCGERFRTAHPHVVVLVRWFCGGEDHVSLHEGAKAVKLLFSLILGFIIALTLGWWFLTGLEAM